MSKLKGSTVTPTASRRGLDSLLSWLWSFSKEWTFPTSDNSTGGRSSTTSRSSKKDSRALNAHTMEVESQRSRGFCSTNGLAELVQCEVKEVSIQMQWDWHSRFETHYVNDSGFSSLGSGQLVHGILHRILCLRNTMVCRNAAGWVKDNLVHSFSFNFSFP